ncbi:hypothetical protein F4801DRAFT_580455 [Xylaria longipes]|nr:hypothetical protein F4801DRAFT_580455 [Xylaria longipes]RYC63555.1 hypothetical protein CHU98_g2618 [Xylaria longipes]
MKTIRLIFDFAFVLAAAASSFEPEDHRCGNCFEEGFIGSGAVQEHGVGATSKDLYVIGGIANNTFPTWISRPNVDDAIYVLGGLTDNGKDRFWNYTTAFFVYRPETDKWHKLPPMPDREARGAAAVGVHGSQIILAGGMRSLNFSIGGHHDTIKRVTLYDTRTQEWRTLRPLPEPRDDLGGAVVYSKFYVMGGRDHGHANIKNTTWALNLKDWKADWVRKKDLPKPRAGFALGIHRRKLVVLGGEGNKANPTGVFAETLVYNTRRDTWKPAMPLKVPRHGMGTSSDRFNIWIPGGGLVDGRAQPDAHFSRWTFWEEYMVSSNLSLVVRDEDSRPDGPHGCYP